MNVCLLWMIALLIVQSSAPRPPKHPIDYCNSQSECGEMKYSYCVGGQQICLPGYIKDGGPRCKGTINAICDYDEDCFNARLFQGFEPFRCILNTCQNATVFFAQWSAEQKKAYRATMTGSPCRTDEHCSELDKTVCMTGSCECKSGYWNHRFYDGPCLPVTNQTCTAESYCDEDGTECFLGICMRERDFFVESNAHNISLHATKRLRGRCVTHYNCRNIPHTYCNNGSCVCKPDFADDYSECRYGLNTWCTEDHQCGIRGVKCLSNKCTYPDKFFAPSNAKKSESYVATRVGGYCREDKHCHNVNNTHCYEEECKCKDGYEFHSKSSSCGEKVFIRCSKDSDCLDDKHCFLDTCLSPDDFFIPSNSHNTSLYAAESLYGYCRSKKHCRNIPYSDCDDNRCICRWSYEDRKNNKCIKNIYSSEIQPCSNQSDCIVWDVCFFNVCESTPVDTNDRDPKEYVAEQLGDNCFAENHCRNIENSECEHYYCVCKPHYESVDGKCVKKQPIRCISNFRCEEPDAICFNNTCVYEDEFFVESNAKNMSLYSAKHVFGICRADHHCRDVNNSYCYENTCNCRHGYEIVSGACKKAVNITCTNQSDCLLPRTFCILNTCLYPEDFLAPSNGYNISLYAAKRVNEFCQTHHHCRDIEHSVCRYRKCDCIRPFRQSGDSCRFEEPEIYPPPNAFLDTSTQRNKI